MATLPTFSLVCSLNGKLSSCLRNCCHAFLLGRFPFLFFRLVVYVIKKRILNSICFKPFLQFFSHILTMLTDLCARNFSAKVNVLLQSSGGNSIKLTLFQLRLAQKCAKQRKWKVFWKTQKIGENRENIQNMFQKKQKVRTLIYLVVWLKVGHNEMQSIN